MWFDKLAQRITKQVVRPWFFWLMVVLIIAWIPTLALLDTGTSDLLIDALCNPLQLVLLVLLQNTQSRQEKALDSRQDTVEISLALLLRHAAEGVQDEARRRSLLEAADGLVENARSSKQLATADIDDE
jgi:low affinity Fe/Cu permease